MASGTLYPMSLAGLTECYVMAIPFFGNTLLGDLFYVQYYLVSLKAHKSGCKNDTTKTA